MGKKIDILFLKIKKESKREKGYNGSRVSRPSFDNSCIVTRPNLACGVLNGTSRPGYGIRARRRREIDETSKSKWISSDGEGCGVMGMKKGGK